MPNTPSMPAFAPVPGYSRTQIDRAGALLRPCWHTPMDEDDPILAGLVDACVASIACREVFQPVPDKTATGLRSAAASERPEPTAPGTRCGASTGSLLDARPRAMPPTLVPFRC